MSAQKSSQLQPDFVMAQRHLTILDESAERFTFRLFRDEKIKGRHNGAEILHGTLDEHWNYLVAQNRRGMGIFVNVNRTDLKGGRLENIKAIRCVFRENDEPGTPELPLIPHLRIETSPGKFHEYLLCEDAPIEEWSGVMGRTVQDYGSDPNAKDLARVLRLAGFYHQKDPATPHLVKIIGQSNQLPYSWDEIKQAFPPVAREQRTSSTTSSDDIQDIVNPDEVIEALSHLDPDCGYEKWISCGMALCHGFAGGEVGFKIWDEWSKTGTKYRPGECLEKWPTFRRKPEGKAVTCATIFHYAKNAGWRSPSKAKKKYDAGAAVDIGEYPPDTMAALHKMNKEYAAVMLGGDFRILREGLEDTCSGRHHAVAFLRKDGFCSFLGNKKFPVPASENNFKYKPISAIWLEWPGRREYTNVVFDPSGRGQDGAYNLFRGFPVEPQKGDWSKMRRHIFEVICGGNADHFNYLMAWMARIVQKPGGQKPGVAVVLKGGKGIGKGMFVDYFGEIFGESFIPIADSEGVTGRFNMHLAKAILVFLDEAVWGGNKPAEGKLKQLITEPSIQFEPKGIDRLTLQNHVNIIIASNEEWIVPATGDERRFFVLKPSEKFRKDTNYFSQIARERTNGGPAAMMHDLLEYDISQVNLRHAPDTEGLSEQVCQSLPSDLAFWQSVLARGYILSSMYGKPIRSELASSTDDLHWPAEVYKYEIIHEYKQWYKGQNERHPKTDQQFWSATWKFWPGGCSRNQKRTPGGRVEFVMLPPLQELRDAFTKLTKINFGFQEPLASDFNDQF